MPETEECVVGSSYHVVVIGVGNGDRMAVDLGAPHFPFDLCDLRKQDGG